MNTPAIEPLTSLTMPPQKKRTRFLNTKQSRFGCYTCKERKVKCTEEKPTCSRCVRSGRTCLGYPPGAPRDDGAHSLRLLASSSATSSDISTPSSSIDTALSICPWAKPDQRRSADLARMILANDPHGVYGPASISIFRRWLPQLSQTTPSVHAATAAFGAAYNFVLVTKGDSGAERLSNRLYGEALQLIQQKVQVATTLDLAPLLLSCILLALAESVQQRQRNALSHVLGAFSMLHMTSIGSQRPPEMSAETTQKSSGSENTPLADAIEKLELLGELFRGMDVEVAAFLWGKHPYLPPIRPTENSFNLKSFADLDGDLTNLQHLCLHFVAEANSDTQIDNPMPMPLVLSMQQGRLIAWLRSWLHAYHTLVETPERDAYVSIQERRHLKLLKAQCLAMLIAISNLRTGTQMSYDKWEKELQEIIRIGESAMEQTSELPNSSSVTSLKPYTSSFGIISPLYLVARKYRHSLWRRKAIRLLQSAGIEGPFNGDQEAAVACRIVELEEGRPYSAQLSLAEIRAPVDIPECKRVWGCWRTSRGVPVQVGVTSQIQFCCHKDLTGASPTDFDPNDPHEGDEWLSWEETVAMRIATAGHVERADSPDLRSEGHFPRDTNKQESHQRHDKVWNEVHGRERPSFFKWDGLHASQRPSYWTHPL